jgi:RNA-directed DNA polymerase
MSREVHVRFREGAGVQLPRATRLVILVNGTEQEARDVKSTVEGHLGAMGLTLSEEKTKVTHWSKPIVFLGYSIHGALRAQGVQIKAILSIPKEKERLIRRELLHIAIHHHIPELDAMLLMNAKFRGWCHGFDHSVGHLCFIPSPLTGEGEGEDDKAGMSSAMCQ